MIPSGSEATHRRDWTCGWKGGLLCGEFSGARRFAGNTSRCSVGSVCGAVNESARGRTKTSGLKILVGSGVFVERPEAETWVK